MKLAPNMTFIYVLSHKVDSIFLEKLREFNFVPFWTTYMGIYKLSFVFFYRWSGNPLKLNSHNYKISGSNPSYNIRPNNFGIFTSWARTCETLSFVFKNGYKGNAFFFDKKKVGSRLFWLFLKIHFIVLHNFV
jgi:hypothetical protein